MVWESHGRFSVMCIEDSHSISHGYLYDQDVNPLAKLERLSKMSQFNSGPKWIDRLPFFKKLLYVLHTNTKLSELSSSDK